MDEACEDCTRQRCGTCGGHYCCDDCPCGLSHNCACECAAYERRMNTADVDYPPPAGPAAAADPLSAGQPAPPRRRTVVTDARAAWTCATGASLMANVMSGGAPGHLGALLGVIYVCPAHQANAEALINAADCVPRIEPAPASHRHDPWPCGHVTAYDYDITAGTLVERSAAGPADA